MKKILYVVSLVFAITVAGNQASAQKHWSHQKKDAVVGGVVGAGTGALVSKNKGKGAVVGGVVGAGTGYLVGRHKDRKGKY